MLIDRVKARQAEGAKALSNNASYGCSVTNEMLERSFRSFELRLALPAGTLVPA